MCTYIETNLSILDVNTSIKSLLNMPPPKKIKIKYPSPPPKKNPQKNPNKQTNKQTNRKQIFKKNKKTEKNPKSVF